MPGGCCRVRSRSVSLSARCWPGRGTACEKRPRRLAVQMGGGVDAGRFVTAARRTAAKNAWQFCNALLCRCMGPTAWCFSIF